MTDLVLGLACNYEPYVYERFLGSFRRSGCTADLVLFVGPNDVSDQMKQVFSRHGANYAIFTAKRYELQSFRYELYTLLLKDHQARYQTGRVFLTDVRDLIAQRDLMRYPFAEAADLFFFSEKQLIGKCDMNSTWIKDAFGQEVLDALAQKTIICSGTTLGGYEAIRIYLEKMSAFCVEIMKKPLTYALGIDQGIHNYLYYYEQLKPLKISVLPNEAGPVNTLHYASKNLNERYEVVDENGTVSYIAHQLDRFRPEQLEAIQKTVNLPMHDLIKSSTDFYATKAG